MSTTMRSMPLSTAYLRHFRGRARRPWIERIALAMVGLLVFIACFGRLLAPDSPFQVNNSLSLQPPSAAHWFGTDFSGRDILSRVLYGAPTTIGASVLAVLCAVALGLIVASIAVTGGRWVDEVLMRCCDVVLALPVMIMALGVAMALGPSLRSAVIAMIVAWTPSFARLARAEMRTTLASTFVESARVMGVGRTRLLVRHVLPNSLDTVYVQATLEMGGATIIMAGMAYIGAGSQPPSADWGLMVQEGTSYLNTAWWASIIPGAMIALTALAFGLAGDALRRRTPGPAARLASGGATS
ncbi:MAG: ABC transporter permease [Actinobacteria bacterium]|nr:ABC transporter permease [Actinomycetota bacterium]